MSLFKNLFGEKDQPIQSYSDFWNWFKVNERKFYQVIQSRENIEEQFFEPLSEKLGELKTGFYFLVGMFDDDTAELILTPDGIIKNVVFVEEIVANAPQIPNWKFTALKPEMDIKNVRIDMEGYRFDNEAMSFYPVEFQHYPDEISIVIVHNQYQEADKNMIINGTYIFLDNYLGELNAVTKLDNIEVIGKEAAEGELIPLSKLKDYLLWREKEFIEKYEGVRYDTEKDNYTTFSAELEDGKPLFAIINTTLLNWDSKASHPWILSIDITYDGDENNGLPDKTIYQLLNDFEDEIIEELKDFDGYLNVGRQTADGVREIYFACKEFRKSSKVIHQMSKKYTEHFEVDYRIYKDKYWQSFRRFQVS